jgi:hypothetical protein
MSQNLKRMFLGAQFLFVKDGSTITNSGGSVTSGVGVKPDGTTDGDWKPLGTVQDYSVDAAFTDDEIFALDGGRKARVDLITVLNKLDAKFTLNELSEHIVQALFSSGAIATSGSATFTPLAGDGQIRGWVRFLHKEGGGTTVLDVQLYAVLRVKNLKPGDKAVHPEVNVMVMTNALNTGISTLAAA